MRIRKAVMITDQSQPPEAGARQVVYTHARTHTHMHTLTFYTCTLVVDAVAGEGALAQKVNLAVKLQNLHSLLCDE